VKRSGVPPAKRSRKETADQNSKDDEDDSEESDDEDEEEMMRRHKEKARVKTVAELRKWCDESTGIASLLGALGPGLNFRGSSGLSATATPAGC